MSVTSSPPTVAAGGWRRLQRPANITEATRWLFGVLALATLAVQTLFSVAADSGWVQAMGVGAAAVLATCWIGSYLYGRVPWWLDPIEAVAVLGFALSGGAPETVFALIISAIWFRALYDSLWRSVTRCVIYVGTVVLTFVLWTAIPGHAALSEIGRNPGGLALVVLTVAVGRQLGRGLATREQSLRVNAVVAATGGRLIGMTDEAAIRALAWDTAVDICSGSRGLRLVRVSRDGYGLRVDAAAGEFETGTALPGGLIDTTSNGATVLTDPGPLNAAAGATLAWVVVNRPQQGSGWLLIGAHKAVPTDVLLALRSLVNLIVLAVSSSEVHRELLAQASVDSLTGLANRATFTAELTAELTGLREGAAVQVLFLDLDDFKNVNDLMGHQAGDLVLREVALRLRRLTRASDVCARLGGDEFAIILRGTPDAVAMDVAQRTVDAIAQPMRVGHRDAQVGASVGIATATAGTDVEVVVHHADVAMYAAKAHGKGRTQLFHPGLLNDDAPSKKFERDLAAAAALGQLSVHYQPILTLPDLRCTAVEALVRWEHPEQGLLPPKDFIHLAEQTGAITGIGEFVLGRACADMMLWRQEHPESPLRIHVNVSARQLDEDDFITCVTRHLAESGLPAGQLVLELTETVILNGPAAVDRLRDLVELGVQIAIDDFGTGYSSLTTLRSLPVTVIKLDRTFVEGALTNATDRTMITAIVRMSRELGLHTIAEGVERAEQRDFLDSIGTDAFQGYLHLRPVPAAQLTGWLATNLSRPPEVSPLRLIRGA